MMRLLLAAALAAPAAAGAAAWQLQPEYPAAPTTGPSGPAQDAEADPDRDARWERLQREREAAAQAEREAQARYERGLRETEAARERYEAELARHRAEVEAAERRQADYEARLEAWRNDRSTGGDTGRPAPREPQRLERPERPASADRNPAPATGSSAPAAAPAESCERQTQRNRQRGRLFGRIVGTAATALGAPGDIGGAVGTLVPVAELLGEAIASMLDCDEQEKAAAATEEAMSGGVGTSVAWRSETREGVSGSSTVTALEAEPGGGECMTVTDIIIVDGEETRAPKRMCRRPPSNRYVRV